MANKHTIAVFDFDGTLTTKDSFLRFILFAAPWYKILGSVMVFPVVIFYFLGLVSNNTAKERVFSYFFGGISSKQFRKISEEFSIKRLGAIIRKIALEKAMWHKNQGHKLVIASASMEDWIRPWAKNHGFDDVIATMPEIKDNKLTGKFSGKNCSGEEKLRRFLNKYPDREKYFIYAYSDSKKDKPLLTLVDASFLKNF